MTPHFTDAELACKCGCGMLPKPDFMEKAERVRVKFGKPLPVTSAARCPAYNAKVSGTGLTGPHTTGRAIDWGVRGSDAVRLMRIMLEEGFTGIGVAQKGSGRFIHGDDLPNTMGSPRPTVLSY